MKHKALIFIAIIILLLVSATLSQAQPAGGVSELPQISIKTLMENVITPLTNTIWGAVDPQTEEEWQELENAAIAMIAIGKSVQTGGSGPMDNDWVKQPAWIAFNLAMTSAAVQAREAIQQKNMDALWEAGDALYAPCEGCHLQFNPGVAGQ